MRLNGWQRLWVIITIFFGVVVIRGTFSYIAMQDESQRIGKK